MTEREMLELAAKAAGLNHYAPGSEGDMYHPRDGMEGLVIDRQSCLNGGSMVWNPLEDDGDALRLAVKLGMDYKVTETACHISVHDDMSITVGAQYAGNIYAATRLAITRAAAEIGKSMT